MAIATADECSCPECGGVLVDNSLVVIEIGKEPVLRGVKVDRVWCQMSVGKHDCFHIDLYRDLFRSDYLLTIDGGALIDLEKYSPPLGKGMVKLSDFGIDEISAIIHQPAPSPDWMLLRAVFMEMMAQLREVTRDRASQVM